MEIKLDSQDKSFFQLVIKTIAANPFSDDRKHLDERISGHKFNNNKRELLKKTIESVDSKIAKLENGGCLKINDFVPEDRFLMEYVFLFDVYHRHIEKIDEFVQLQLAKGQENLEVPFADDAISQLIKRGFDRQRAIKCFAMICQIRRAFYLTREALIGEGESMKRLRMNLWNCIFTDDIIMYEQHLWNRMEDFSVLLLGPTGSGKGSAASAIGMSGYIDFNPKTKKFDKSFTELFIPINLSQFPESLIESELFGHKKGAFTGAINDYDGLFKRAAQHCCVFMDEIGEISEQIQIKLLQVLQERFFVPIGSQTRQRFNGRVIAATHQSLETLREKNKFRDDFYYRLCSDSIEVPSLADCIKDDSSHLSKLVKHLVTKIVMHDCPQVEQRVLEVISRLGKDYHWPGNVRELEQCIRRVIIKGDYQGDKLIPDIENNFSRVEFDPKITDAKMILAKYCTLLYSQTQSYEKVARMAGLDRRTVKKYIELTAS